MKRGEPRRRRRPRAQAEDGLETTDAVATGAGSDDDSSSEQAIEPSQTRAEANAPVQAAETETMAEAAAPTGAEDTVVEAKIEDTKTQAAAAETEVEIPQHADPVEPETVEIEVAEIVTAAEKPAVTAAPPAEAPSAAAAHPVAASKPAGITADGRAANDPRIAPRAVGQVEITTDHPPLFREEQYPPVQAGKVNAPRASNDPRGPRSGTGMREAAEG